MCSVCASMAAKPWPSMSTRRTEMAWRLAHGLWRCGACLWLMSTRAVGCPRGKGMQSQAVSFWKDKPPRAAPRPGHARAPLPACLRSLQAHQHSCALDPTAHSAQSPNTRAKHATPRKPERAVEGSSVPPTKDHQRRPDGACMPQHLVGSASHLELRQRTCVWCTASLGACDRAVGAP